MSNQVIHGTVKELVARKLTIGGVLVDTPTLYSLARLGIARNVGEQKSTPTAKRASAVYELPTEIELKLTAVIEAP